MYNEDYFENGIEKGVSLYSNYRWLPEQTLVMAHELITGLSIGTTTFVLDYGCAKGYLVKALRMLGINAYGYDSSEYAIKNADDDVVEYVSTSLQQFHDCWDLVIAKDVLEHMTVEQVDEFLSTCFNFSDELFVVVPLGDGERYHIPSYELDKTHIIKQSLEWWKARAEKVGYEVDALYQFKNLKKSWAKVDPKGNGFLICSRPNDYR